MKWILPLALVVLTLSVRAQEPTKEDLEWEKKSRDKAAKAEQDTTLKYGWINTGAIGANLSQSSFANWVQGGENALAYSLVGSGGFEHHQERTTWTTNVRLAYGQTRLGSGGLRKTDDEIYLATMLIYKLGTYINPYVSATLRTQFAKGYRYDAQGVGTPVSAFFDPGRLMQSIGAAYKPVPEVTTRLGAGLREVVTSRYSQYHYADDPLTPEIEKTRVQGGMEWVTSAEWKFAENMTYVGSLQLFAPFKTMDRIVVRCDNNIVAKVNKFISVNFGVQLINEPDVYARTQVAEVLNIGLSYAVF
jgi:hypothetical protein